MERDLEEELEKTPEDLLSGKDVDGHTDYLQGVSLPIMVNSVLDKSSGQLSPCAVSEMHICEVNGEKVLVITPSEIGL